MSEDASQVKRSSMVSAQESQDMQVPSPSPSPSQTSPTHSLTLLSGGGVVGESAGAKDSGPSAQINAITVLTLLDKLVNMLDTVQENQNKMEQRQAEMEGAVRGIQSDMTKLSKCHTSTSNTVSKLLEKSRKVTVHMKEIRDRMDKQGVQVKKLEANHAHLLKRNHFKVLIFQEENEIPTSVFMKDPEPFPREAEEEMPAVEANHSHEGTLQSINLSSDEDIGPEEEDEEARASQDLSEDHLEWSRAEKLKRSSLKKVDSLKKAFSRQNIEKKMNKISTKIVSTEQREKLRKSFTTNQQKSQSARSSSFKVAPLTFNVKKVRDGEVSPTAVASSEIATLNSKDEDQSYPELYSPLTPTSPKSADYSLDKEELPSSSASGVEAELSIKQDENALSDNLPQEDPNHYNPLQYKTEPDFVPMATKNEEFKIKVLTTSSTNEENKAQDSKDN